MRFFHAAFFLVLTAVIDIEAFRRGIVIRAYRVDTKIYPGNGLLSTKVPITNGQPITYFKDVDEGTLYFVGNVTYRFGGREINVASFDWHNDFDICTESDYGDWYEIMKEVLRKSWFPDGSCPVKAGIYTLKDPIEPIEMNAQEEVDSYYEYVIDGQVGYSKSRRVFSAKYAVQIIPDGSFK